MKRIKLILYIVLVSVMSVILSGCDEVDSHAMPVDIMAKIKVAIPEKEMIDGIAYIGMGQLHESNSIDENGELSDEMMSEIYKSDFNVVESYSIWISEDSSVTEIGVFKLKDIDDTEEFMKVITDRVETLKESVSKEDELTKIENAVISSKGKYVYYLVTNINSILEEVLLNEISSQLIA
jgi:hypothetical protein